MKTLVVPLAPDVNVPVIGRRPRRRVSGADRRQPRVGFVAVQALGFEAHSGNLRLDGYPFEVPDEVPVDDGMVVDAVGGDETGVPFAFEKVLELFAKNEGRQVGDSDGLADDGVVQLVPLLL